MRHQDAHPFSDQPLVEQVTASVARERADEPRGHLEARERDGDVIGRAADKAPWRGRLVVIERIDERFAK